MRRKMLLFSPSLLAETLWLWCSSSRAALFELFFWTPGAPIVINDSQLCRTIAEAPRHIPHQIVPLPQTTQWAHWIVLAVVCLANTQDWGLFLFVYHFTQMVTDRPWKTPLEDFHWPLSWPSPLFYIHFLLFSSSLPLILHPASSFLLFAQLLCVPLFPCLPSLTANKAWYMYSAFTFFCPVIYAVRSFPLFGWPGFHVCAKQYLGVLTRSSVFSMKQTVAGNWWGVYCRRLHSANCEEPHQVLTPPIRLAGEVIGSLSEVLIM